MNARLLLLMLLAAGCSRTATEHGPVTFFAGYTMGVAYSVKLGPGSGGDGLDGDVAGMLARLDATLSTWKTNSEVCRFSAHRGTNWFPVSAGTARLAAMALEISAWTDGAFDVTVDPLVRLWGFGPGRTGDRPPSDAAIAAALRHVGCRGLRVWLDPPALRKDDPAISVDFSGIAKGFAVEAVAARLESLGVTNFLVAVGGELRSRGSWRVGIEKPDGDGSDVLRAFPLRDAAVSTSGDYRNFFARDGQRHAHAIDPRTGRPVTNNVASVTVIHPDGATADALATALAVMGAEAGMPFAVRNRLPCLFVLRSAGGLVERASPGFIAATREESR